MFCNSASKTDEDDKNYTKAFLNTNKLLLLGTGESGKTTIIKQMKILHINGFTLEEVMEKAKQIRQNVHESIYDIVLNMDKLTPKVEFEKEENKAYAEYILSLGEKKPCDNYNIDEYYDRIKSLWEDCGVQQCFSRSNEYQLIDSAEYFLNKLDSIRSPDYVPSTQDILHCRVETKAISKIEFSVKINDAIKGGVADFWMYDVGGQRGHRKKWIQVFQDAIKAILFLVAASDFDQTLREDQSKNRLEEAFELFNFIHCNRYLRNSGLIVFLNKQDLLEKKIREGRKVEDYFPEYRNFVPDKKECPNGDDEYLKARAFMKQKLIDISKKEVTIEVATPSQGKNAIVKLPERNVYIHYTIATDTKNIKTVFEDVQQLILKENYANVGFL